MADLSISTTASNVMAKANVLAAYYGTNISTKGVCFSTSRDMDEVINQIGNEIGINDPDKNEDNLTWDHYVSSENNADEYLFQGGDGNFYDLDFQDMTYSSQSEVDFATEYGLINDNAGKTYDVVNFKQGTGSFTNYKNIGSNDSTQNKIFFDIGNLRDGGYGDWGNITFTEQELDISKITLSDSADYEENLANSSFISIMNNIKQWCPTDKLTELNNKYTKYSPDWCIAVLKLSNEYILKN